MIQTTITVPNRAGLHARAAAKLVEVTSRFSSSVEIGGDGKMVDGKSILSLMLLAASQGTQLQLAIDGGDEKEAFEAIQDLINRCFDED